MKKKSPVRPGTTKRIVLGVFLLAAAMLFFFGYINRPAGDGSVEMTVFIPRGAGFLEIAEMLDQAGVVKKPRFVVLSVLRGAAGSMKPGEYELTTGMSPLDIIGKLYRGDIKRRRVTIPEDWTLKQIAGRLAEQQLVSVEQFLGAATDTDFLAALKIPADSAEGYLYPETYSFYRGMTAHDMIREMVGRFRRIYTSEMQERADALRLDTAQVVTLASLIGKETGSPQEKESISAVFHNRMRIGMMLQSDPTAVYSLDSYRSVVRKKDLEQHSPYNTYKIRGLPPGPIANPGIDSLKAALYPASVPYLYFVSKKDGTHAFSTTLAAHRQAVIKYQIKRGKQ